MSLIRGGHQSDFPCPVCLVPNAHMSDGSTHPLRTSKSMQKVFNEAAAMATKAEQDKYLQGYGLRDVKV